ncbi:coiled-coil domain-containing protein 62 isoform X2 [Stegostoma tigrinum]|uniref:coiled-coil domain-containing protein 62 isoform X2 n=1 Tax=Stegostoma tigrinum TaxID=3053191 RepID=UPI00202B3301|nr:coiled-coil domain-containing protein 62 isoform X2 [Stegostoma tigrinum]
MKPSRRHRVPGVEMEGNQPSGDFPLINPRNPVNASSSASETHLEQWHSPPKSKPSLENVSCSKSIGDSKMNFGKMQDFAATNAGRYKTCPTKAIQPVPILNASAKNNANADLENATIQKQRNELQLLVAELKDRDKELNEMVAAHQKQLLAWEEDRLRILSLEERCAKLEHELRNRNEIIRSLGAQQKILESQQADCLKTLTSTQQRLKEMSEKAAEAANNCEELEDRNKTLNSSNLELSAQVGQLQAREQELTTMLELKDKDMVEATNHIMDLTARFKTLEGALREARINETNTRKEVHDCKQHSKKLRHEICKLKDELDEKTVENNEQREEIIRLKQERQYLGNELTLAVEREKRKEQILELARSKQERADTELHGLRQVNEKQQHDLQLLHLNLESSQELIQKQEEKILEISSSRLLSDSMTQSRDGQNEIEGQECKNNVVRKWKKEASKDCVMNRHKEETTKSMQNFSGELIPNNTKEQSHLLLSEVGNTTRNYSSTECMNAQTFFPTNFDQTANGNLTFKGYSLQTNVDSNKKPTKYVLPKQSSKYTTANDCISPQSRDDNLQQVSKKQKWRFEGSSDVNPMECMEQYNNVNYANTDHHSPRCSSSCKGNLTTSSVDNHYTLCSKTSATSIVSTKEGTKTSENHKMEDKYCNEPNERKTNDERIQPHTRNETDQEPPNSEQDWMKIYQPAVDVKDLWWLYLNDGSGSSHGLDSPTSMGKKSEERLELNTFNLDSPPRSVNSSPVRERSKGKSSIHGDLSVNDSVSPVRLNTNEDNERGSSNNTYRDGCSPTTKLQRLLAESRQMVASLERSTQLPLGLSSCASSNNTARRSKPSQKDCKFAMHLFLD